MEELFFVFGGFMFIAIGLGIACYILSSLALMKMAERRSIDNPWLSWIPYGNMFILGKIVGDEIVVFGKQITNLGLVLLISTLVSSVIASIPLIGLLFVVAFAVLIYMVYYKLFMEIKPESATLYLVLSIIVPGALSIILFMLNKHEQV